MDSHDLTLGNKITGLGGRKLVHICPKCGGKRFSTTVRVTQTWEVDEDGNFLSEISGCDDVMHGPDDGNIWTCLECGSDAVIAEEGSLPDTGKDVPAKDGVPEPALKGPSRLMSYGSGDDKVVFDDFVAEEDGCWAEICPACLERYKQLLAGRTDDGAMGICSVKGCQNDAEYYVDFEMDEVRVFNLA